MVISHTIANDTGHQNNKKDDILKITHPHVPEKKKMNYVAYFFVAFFRQIERDMSSSILLYKRLFSVFFRILELQPN